MLRKLRNLMVDMMAACIRDREARHAFRNKYKKKSEYRILKDLYNQLINENDILRSQLKSMRDENQKQLRRLISAQESNNAIRDLSSVNNLSSPLFHFSAWGNSNAGDNLLVLALKKSIESLIGHFDYIDRNVRTALTGLDVDLINKSKGVVIGGGGLFLKDTNANDISGWQFPISVKQIEEIKAPMLMLAVGYNRFRGQDDFEPVFKENINAMVRKCKFVGIRNRGSINALRGYLDDDLKDKPVFHPCATTILSKLYDMPEADRQEPFVALNCAFDRSAMRYGERKDEILDATARVMAELSKDIKIKYYVNYGGDQAMLPYLDKNNVKYELVSLSGPSISTTDILREYSAPSLVIGMRGHAQMIPFGCGTPILSIVSHNKMAWFLDDIEHPEWGADVQSKDYGEILLSAARAILSDERGIRKKVLDEQEKLYTVTKDNFKSIAAFLK